MVTINVRLHDRASARVVIAARRPRTAARDGEWNEAEHERADNGEFSKTGGLGEGAASEPSTGEGSGKRAQITEHVVQEGVLDHGLLKDEGAAKGAAHGLTAGLPADETVSAKWRLVRNEIAFEAAGSAGSAVRRVFRKRPDGSWEVEHASFTIPEGKQGGGGSKRMMESSLEAYEKLGISRVRVHAGLSVGGYAWAKRGFAPNDPGRMRQVVHQSARMMDRAGLSGAGAELRRIAAESSDRSLLYDLARAKSADEPNLGKRVLQGAEWDGHIDLRNPEDRERVKKALRDAWTNGRLRVLRSE